jgi:hypothetical protein
MLIQNKINTIDTNKSGCGQHGNTIYPLPSRFGRTIKRNLIVYSRLSVLSVQLVSKSIQHPHAHHNFVLSIVVKIHSKISHIQS